MKNYSVSSDIRRALASKGFLTGTAGMALMILIASLNSIASLLRGTELLTGGYHAQLILDALASEDVTLALPILCTLPFATAFIDDIKSGYIKQYLPRAGVKPYIRGKLIACGLTGGLTLFAGIMLAYGLSALAFTPMEIAPDPDMITQPYYARILTCGSLLFLSGAFWSLTGFAFAALTMSRYMAYASPFILYYVLIILHERYLEGLYVLYPKEWMFPSDSWVLGNWGVVLLLLELSAAMCLTFAVTAGRRLRHV